MVNFVPTKGIVPQLIPFRSLGRTSFIRSQLRPTIQIHAEEAVSRSPKFSVTRILTEFSVWWSGARDYKNAITNELFILTSAQYYLRTGNQVYLNNAKKVHVFCWVLSANVDRELTDLGVAEEHQHEEFQWPL